MRAGRRVGDPGRVPLRHVENLPAAPIGVGGPERRLPRVAAAGVLLDFNADAVRAHPLHPAPDVVGRWDLDADVTRVRLRAGLVCQGQVEAGVVKQELGVAREPAVRRLAQNARIKRHRCVKVAHRQRDVGTIHEFHLRSQPNAVPDAKKRCPRHASVFSPGGPWRSVPPKWLGVSWENPARSACHDGRHRLRRQVASPRQQRPEGHRASRTHGEGIPNRHKTHPAERQMARRVTRRRHRGETRHRLAVANQAGRAERSGTHHAGDEALQAGPRPLTRDIGRVAGGNPNRGAGRFLKPGRASHVVNVVVTGSPKSVAKGGRGDPATVRKGKTRQRP